MKPIVLQIRTENEDATRALGFKIGKLLSPGTVLGLNGTLGSGKTRLVQGICHGLGIESPVVSPTYTICTPYEGRLRLLHLDVYRIEDPIEIDELGLDEEIEDGAVIVVEWASRMQSVLPPTNLDIAIEPVADDPNQRLIEIQGDETARTLLNAVGSSE